MTKIKTFQIFKNISEQEENNINLFIKDKNVIDIKVNMIGIHPNPNGYSEGELVTLYTIIYEE